MSSPPTSSAICARCSSPSLFFLTAAFSPPSYRRPLSLGNPGSSARLRMSSTVLVRLFGAGRTRMLSCLR